MESVPDLVVSARCALLTIASVDAWNKALEIGQDAFRTGQIKEANLTPEHMRHAWMILKQNADIENGTDVTSVIWRNYIYYLENNTFHPDDIGGPVLSRVAEIIPRFQPPPHTNTDCHKKICEVSLELAQLFPSFAKHVRIV